MQHMKCTKEALAESIFRLINEEIREMNTFDMLALRNAHKKEQRFSEIPVKVQAQILRMTAEVISEFEE